MPELPSVEYARRLLLDHVRGHTVRRVEVVADEIVFQGVPEHKVQHALEGRRVEDVGRHGKYLWLVLDNGTFLLMHFGMTGFVEVKGVGRLYYRSAPETEAGAEERAKEGPMDWPPRFWKLQVETDGGLFVFGDARRLGRIKVLADEPMTVPPCSLLGFDPLTGMPAPDAAFIASVRRRNVSLKGMLLDQSFAAGVGNWMADDIMLHARLHPESRTSALSDDDIRRLHQAIRFITEEACAANADGSKFPPNWLFHCRWPSSVRAGVKPVSDGHRVEFIRVAGRTTALVPALQKRARGTGEGGGGGDDADLANERPMAKRAKGKRARQ